MNWLIYTGVVLFGATALLIEARRNYRESLAQTPFQRHPILQSAQVSDLCTDRDGFIGFLVYSMLYLVSYGVILSSAELYELVRNANLAKLEVGATGSFDPFGNDILNLEGTAYAKPIFVSAFLIAIMSVGVMRPIENMVRSAAHRIAGIPRGVYRVIDALQTPDAVRICHSHRAGPLTRHYRMKLDQTKPEDLVVDLSGRREEVDKALSVIDALSSAVMPGRRAQYFPVAELEELTKMSKQLEGELGQMTRVLLNFDPTSGDELVELHGHAMQVAENTKALFAVHYIRNNQSVKNLDHGTPLARIVDVIDRNYVPEKNSFALAAFVSSVISVLTIFTIYSTWWSWSVETYPLIASEQIEMLIESLNASQAGRGALGDQSVTLEQCLDGALSQTCGQLIAQGQRDFIYEIRPDLVAQSIWDTLQMALVTFAAAGAVIFGRDVRLEQESWKPGWSMHRIPFVRLLGLCVVPAIFAFFFAIAGQLLELAFDTGFEVTQSQVIQQVNDNIVYFAMMPLTGLSVGFGILVIMDKHDDFSRLRTVTLLALPCAIIVGLIIAANIFVSYNFPDRAPFDGYPWITGKTRDWMIMSVLPMMFLLLFAWFIELTEEPIEVEEAEDLGALPAASVQFRTLMSRRRKAGEAVDAPSPKDVA